MTDHLIIFDTTLRDGEQSPGASMTAEEKMRIAKQLERLADSAGIEGADGHLEALNLWRDVRDGRVETRKLIAVTDVAAQRALLRRVARPTKSRPLRKHARLSGGRLSASDRSILVSGSCSRAVPGSSGVRSGRPAPVL